MLRTTKERAIYERVKRDVGPNHRTKVIHPYQYWGKVVKVVDGDTIDVVVAVGFDIEVRKRVRLLGVDTPEIYGVKKGSKEYAEGKKIMNFVKSKLSSGKWIELRTYEEKREKYGRLLAEVFTEGVCINKELIKKGYALTYDE